MQLFIIFPATDQAKPKKRFKISKLPPTKEITPEITGYHIAEAEAFIKRYTYIETTLNKTTALKYLQAQQRGRPNHIKAIWETIIKDFMCARRNFGAAYLGMEPRRRIMILMAWGIFPEHRQEYEAYLRPLAEGRPDAIYTPPPPSMQIIDFMMLFFATNFINYRCTDTVGFSHIPADPMRQIPGSQNWALHLHRYKDICQRYPEDYTGAMRAILSHHSIKVKK